MNGKALKIENLAENEAENGIEKEAASGAEIGAAVAILGPAVPPLVCKGCQGRDNIIRALAEKNGELERKLKDLGQE